MKVNYAAHLKDNSTMAASGLQEDTDNMIL